MTFELLWLVPFLFSSLKLGPPEERCLKATETVRWRAGLPVLAHRWGGDTADSEL